MTQKLVKRNLKKFTYHDHAKYITTQEFNKLMSGNLVARLAQTIIILLTS